jgi:putative addiction module killer protein
MILNQTEVFEKWYNSLKDIIAVAAIKKRLDKIERENHFGDYKGIKGVKGLYELRFYIGKGYRIYYTIQNNVIVLLINGGIKKEQKKDILKAAELLKCL